MRRPMVTCRSSCITVRESGCGFHCSLSSGYCVSLAIARILSCTLFQLRTTAASSVAGGVGPWRASAVAASPKTSRVAKA